ncbi:leucine-rich repeat domain-containing protein [Carnobacterium maltaromaticum]|uniref:leucine-rich repeat domain-containing protein n=1 Tax=Carnobacterium maltaromaticum TaxID=2751 RepID=UPI00191BC16F|nr:leucine-rich repeat domain-containing protein [Carnobacterium maltaromaticum]CAD5903047.1 putative Leucine Rich Repeat domain protein [Carnobacterium maltaromaticum]
MKKILEGILESTSSLGGTAAFLNADEEKEKYLKEQEIIFLQACDKDSDSVLHGIKKSTVNKATELNEIIEIPDKSLKNAIKRVLEISESNSITKNDLLNLTKLVIINTDGQVSNLSGIEYAENLELVTFSNQRISDLSPIKKLYKLYSIGINGNPIIDFSPLYDLNITELAVNNTSYSLEDLSQLKNKGKLTILHLDQLELTNLDFLKETPNLKQFTSSYNHLKNINGLRYVTGLTYYASMASEMTDISGLENLNELVSLNISGNQIKSIEPLTELTNLEQLSISYNQLYDLTPLSNSNNLKLLEFRNNEVSDITPLNNLSNIEVLVAHSNKIKDISILNKMPLLKKLSLSGNPLSNPILLEKNENLEQLYISQIGLASDQAPSLPNLTFLEAEINELTNLKFLEKSTKLSELRLRVNHISDISSLAKLTELRVLYTQLQNIELEDIHLGDSTSLVLKDLTGNLPTLDWKTEGTYKDDNIEWTNLGENKVSWTAHSKFFEGEIVQNVIK